MAKKVRGMSEDDALMLFDTIRTLGDWECSKKKDIEEYVDM